METKKKTIVVEDPYRKDIYPGPKPEDDKSDGEQTPPLMKIFLPWILAIAFLVFGFLSHRGATISRAKILERNRYDVAELQSKIRARRLTLEQQAKQFVLLTTGSSPERRTRDMEVLEDLMDYIFTWSSYTEYEDIRQTLINVYHLDPNGTFLSKFYRPVIESGYVNSKGEYVEINDIALNEMKLRFANFKAYNIGVADGNYVYFGWVTWYVQNNKSSQMATGESLITCTIDPDGHLIDLGVYTAPDH